MVVQRQQTGGRRVLDIPAWLPDDTEESVVGTVLHQITISTLADHLRMAGPERGASWDVGSQLSLTGLARPDGTAYSPMPDVFITRYPLDRMESAIDVGVQGMPPLVIEVASPSTVRHDVGDKARVYLRAGALEYLVFDPLKEYLGVEVWARRVERGRIVRWRPDRRGWWWSAVCGVAFEPQGALLRVRDARGVVIETSREAVAARIAAERAEADERDRRIAAEQARAEEERRRIALEARLAELERRLASGDPPVTDH